MTREASALYFGEVMHKRLRPFVHAFRYRVFSLFIDLDELDACDRELRLFSHNRWNLVSFHDRDHGARDGTALRPWIDTQLAAAGIELAGGPVRILCFPRVFGYVFSPLSIWFCHHADGSLRAILYEVRNTFGGKHGYLIPVAREQAGGGPVVQSADKRFYVSPFIAMDSRYHFRLAVPGERLAVAIRQDVAAGSQLIARQTGRRRPLSDASLLRALFAYPLMTTKVIGSIHWQALRLWIKGAKIELRPATTADAVTLVGPASAGGRQAAE